MMFMTAVRSLLRKTCCRPAFLFLFISLSFNFLSVSSASVASSTATISDSTVISANDFRVLCYHDVNIDPEDKNIYSLSVVEFKQQLQHLKENYNFISLQDLIEASSGRKTLPRNAVLLTFDDGLLSFYQNVFPILKQEKIPAVYAVVGRWVELGFIPDTYGPQLKTSSWKQISEMAQSGLVDVVSHTYDLHRYGVNSPQGHTSSVLGVLPYDNQKQSYLAKKTFKSHLQKDLAQNQALIKKHTNQNFPVIVWPYGDYQGLASEVAAAEGLTMQMTLASGANSLDRINTIGRGLIIKNTPLSVFAEKVKDSFVEPVVLKMLIGDLSRFEIASKEQTVQQFSELLKKPQWNQANSALLKVVNNSGQAFFGSSVRPVAKDHFTDVAKNLRTRTPVRYIFASVPLEIFKSATEAEAFIADLALKVDVRGIFFEVKKLNSKNRKILKSAIQAGQKNRPYWKFGLKSEEAISFPEISLSLVTSENDNFETLHPVKGDF